MALDGIMVHALRAEFESVLVGERVLKIQQPDSASLLFQFKTREGTRRLLLSANATLPYAALINSNRTGPEEAPAFLMLLRKHLNGARLLSVRQWNMDRILIFTFEHLNELGDTEERKLILEIMGRHSNLILTDENDVILDAIRRVPPTLSSVRTVLPQKAYEIPDVRVKKDPLTETCEGFLLSQDPKKTFADDIFTRYSGFSVSSASELVYGAGLDPDLYIQEASKAQKEQLADAFLAYTARLKEDDFSLSLAEDAKKEVLEFSAMPLPSFAAAGNTVRAFTSPSALVEYALTERANRVVMKQRSGSLRSLIETNLHRIRKKLELQEKQLKETEGCDRDRLYGELLTAYSYQLEKGQPSATVPNYYDNNEEITIPLDRMLTPSENAQRYFKRYQKAKRTRDALEKLIPEAREEVDYLESILSSIVLAEDDNVLKEIRKELSAAGYVHKESGKKQREKIQSQPYHYRSSDGFDIYVGKNNLQNDALSLHFAEKKDLFFHVKKAAGSHVILKTEGREVPDRAYQEAAALAVYYSSLRENGRGEVDYVEAGKLKKPAGAPAGFVVYYTNYSMVQDADISGLSRIS